MFTHTHCVWKYKNFTCVIRYVMDLLYDKEKSTTTKCVIVEGMYPWICPWRGWSARGKVLLILTSHAKLTFIRQFSSLEAGRLIKTMEFPELGRHCSEPTCHKLDFLPVKCDACGEIFCHEHMSYMKHNCPKSDAKNVQVPVCPLCNKPVPSKRGEMPDIAVGAHIDRDCQSDPAKNRRKVFSNKCTLKGCKKRELLPMICKECGLNFCITHRHPADHSCTKQKKSYQPNGMGKVLNPSSFVNSIQGQMTEDEALAHAIALSLEDSANPSTSRSNGHSLRNVAGSLTEWTRKAQKPNSPTSEASCNVS